jgi:hypothetical protein
MRAVFYLVEVDTPDKNLVAGMQLLIFPTRR